MKTFRVSITTKTGQCVLREREVQAEFPYQAGSNVAEAYCGNEGRISCWSSMAGGVIKFAIEADDDLLVKVVEPCKYDFYAEYA